MSKLTRTQQDRIWAQAASFFEAAQADSVTLPHPLSSTSVGGSFNAADLARDIATPGPVAAQIMRDRIAIMAKDAMTRIVVSRNDHPSSREFWTRQLDAARRLAAVI